VEAGPRPTFRVMMQTSSTVNVSGSHASSRACTQEIVPRGHWLYRLCSPQGNVLMLRRGQSRPMQSRLWPFQVAQARPGAQHTSCGKTGSPTCLYARSCCSSWNCPSDRWGEKAEMSLLGSKFRSSHWGKACCHRHACSLSSSPAHMLPCTQ